MHHLANTACFVLTTMLAIVATTALGNEKSAVPETLWIGTATVSITPDEPVALDGQMKLRIAKTVESPLTANVVVLESRQGDRPLDLAIMVSCDLLLLPQTMLDKTRQAIHKQLPQLDTSKVFLNATHTHTAPCLRHGTYRIPKDIMQVDAYHEFFARRVGDAVEKAWNARKPGGVSWGLGHAVVGYNRRIVYDDDSAVMYGETADDHFRAIEGPEDHGVEVLFFWDENRKPIAAAINVACPAQEVETRTAVNADFWHPVREALREKYGKDLCILAWCGAAGDQSPHYEARSTYRKNAEERMQKQRGLTHLEEIARRIVRAVDDVYDATKSDIHYDVPLVHRTKTLKLPKRLVTDKEYQKTKDTVARLKKAGVQSRALRWNQKVLDRYETQKTDRLYDVELHVLRLGDIAIATNPFELFTAYGIQMKARSKALQTFVVQLAGPGTYLPTAKAVQGGGYSAIIQSNLVGPEGGQTLVDHTVKEINQLWPLPQNGPMLESIL